MKLKLAGTVVALLLAAGNVFGDSPVLDIGAGWAQKRNISAGADSDDIKDDEVFTLSGNSEYLWQTSESTDLRITGGAAYNAHESYRDIDNLRLDLGALLEFRPDRSFNAPWYSLSGKLTVADYESDIRDASIFEVRAGAAKRFTDRLTARAFLGFNSSSADEAFRTRYNEFITRVDYLVHDSVVLYGGVGTRTGDIVATTRPNSTLSLAADAFAADDAIGDGRFAYRLDADSLSTDIGVNWAISRAAALDFAFERHSTDARGDHDYDQSIFWFAWLYRD